MKKKNKISFNQLWQKYGTISILLLLILILAILKPSSIFSINSIQQIMTQSSVNILLAVGEFFAILIAGIDLSVGSVAALTGMIAAKLMVSGVTPIIAVAVGNLSGALLGFINGTIINNFDNNFKKYK